ncbi:hypothetical protein GCM10023237_68470 [Streptomyces coeruleoprunus]
MAHEPAACAGEVPAAVMAVVASASAAALQRSLRTVMPFEVACVEGARRARADTVGSDGRRAFLTSVRVAVRCRLATCFGGVLLALYPVDELAADAATAIPPPAAWSGSAQPRAWPGALT